MRSNYLELVLSLYTKSGSDEHTIEMIERWISELKSQKCPLISDKKNRNQITKRLLNCVMLK